MRISNSKKELARIISENGGWRDGAKFTAQDGDGTGSMDFFKSKPQYDKDDKRWKGEYDYQNRIKHVDVTIKNFHQTILSREEYFHLYPAPDADGWIEFDGTERPSGYFNRIIDAKLQDGRVMTDSSGRFEWDTDGPSRIIAYRLHKPGQAEDERCIQEAFVPEAKPSIEQLAADYRNRKDYADRKQQEADAAKADAEAKLAELVAAGKAIGLSLSVADADAEPEPEPELVITDWRDLMIGDEVKIIESMSGNRVGEIGVVSRFDKSGKGREVRVIFGGREDDYEWLENWKFIRRP